MASNERKKFTVLSKREWDEIYSIPKLTAIDREEGFAETQNEKRLLKEVKSRKAKLSARLMCFYFKLNQQITPPEDFKQRDIQYAINHFFSGDKSLKPATTSSVISEIKKLILKHFGYKECTPPVKAKIQKFAENQAQVDDKEEYLFQVIYKYCTSKKIILPPSYVIDQIISDEINNVELKLIQGLEQHLTDEQKSKLLSLIKKMKEKSEFKKSMQQPKDFNTTEIDNEILRKQALDEPFQICKRIVKSLKIRDPLIKRYAENSRVFGEYRIRQYYNSKQCLYLICAVTHRYKQITDNLVNMFCTRAKRYINDAKKDADGYLRRTRNSIRRNIPKAGRALNLALDKEKYREIDQIKSLRKAWKKVISEEDLKNIADFLENDLRLSKIEWMYYDGLNMRVESNITPIFESLDFKLDHKDKVLKNAISKLKIAQKRKELLEDNQHIVKDVIPERIWPHLTPSSIPPENREIPHIKKNLYKWFIYMEILKGIEGNYIYFEDSYKYRSIKDDLLSDSQWKNKAQYLNKSGLPKVKQTAQAILKNLIEQNEKLISDVNAKLRIEELDGVKLIGNEGRWRVTDETVAPECDSIFYENFKHKDLANVIQFVNSHTNFLDEFYHRLPKGVQRNQTHQEIIAVLIALGTNLNIWKMAKISDLSKDILYDRRQNLFHEGSLKKAIQAVSGENQRLPIYKLFKLGDENHGALDGQKWEASIDTILVRYSRKYFAVGKGLSVMSLVNNNIPYVSRVIGANEHESHYLLDIIRSYEEPQELEWISTDNHGVNQINFGLLYMFDYIFAPRYKNINNKFDKIVGERRPLYYRNELVRPSKQINKKLIIEEWDNIQRIVCSLENKTTSQATIVRKLSSHKNRNKTKLALWELNDLVRSIYVLSYLKQVEIRKNVHAALNRVEAYHQLRRNIFFANGGKYRNRHTAEYDIWTNCSQLIANCIVYYNSYILSQLEHNGDEKFIEELRHISPVAWRHINFYGRYKLSLVDDQNETEGMIKDALSDKTIFQLKYFHDDDEAETEENLDSETLDDEGND